MQTRRSFLGALGVTAIVPQSAWQDALKSLSAELTRAEDIPHEMIGRQSDEWIGDSLHNYFLINSDPKRHVHNFVASLSQSNFLIHAIREEREVAGVEFLVNIPFDQQGARVPIPPYNPSTHALVATRRFEVPITSLTDLAGIAAQPLSPFDLPRISIDYSLVKRDSMYYPTGDRWVPPEQLKEWEAKHWIHHRGRYLRATGTRGVSVGGVAFEKNPAGGGTLHVGFNPVLALDGRGRPSDTAPLGRQLIWGLTVQELQRFGYYQFVPSYYSNGQMHSFCEEAMETIAQRHPSGQLEMVLATAEFVLQPDGKWHCKSKRFDTDFHPDKDFGHVAGIFISFSSHDGKPMQISGINIDPFYPKPQTKQRDLSCSTIAAP